MPLRLDAPRSLQLASREEAVLYALRLLGRETARERRARAVEDMREIARRNTLGPGLTIRELIDEGRKY